MKLLPIGRNSDVVVQNFTDEVLIYDLIINKAFCLNDTLAKVFHAWNGKTSFIELEQRFNFTDDLIYLALNELKTNNLLAEKVESHFGELSRRELIRRVGLASIIALPVISSLIAPTALMAQSCVSANQPVGTPLTNGNPGTCIDTAYIQLSDALCAFSFGGSCCSRTASANVCTQITPTQYSFNCICG